MDLITQRRLEESFGHEDFTFVNIRHVSYSNNDNEALKDVSAFTGIPWTDVTPTMLKKRFEVFAFFSNFAFFIFTPALIRSSLQNVEMTHLSVAVFLNTLIEHRDLPTLNQVNAERWRQFSKNQLELIVSWIKGFDGDFLIFFERGEIDNFLDCLDTLVLRASEFERNY